LENAALVLLAAGNDFGELVNAFVDGFTAASFNYGALDIVDNIEVK
jgi:hypothetical protein